MPLLNMAAAPLKRGRHEGPRKVPLTKMAAAPPITHSADFVGSRAGGCRAVIGQTSGGVRRRARAAGLQVAASLRGVRPGRGGGGAGGGSAALTLMRSREVRRRGRAGAVGRGWGSGHLLFGELRRPWYALGRGLPSPRVWGRRKRPGGRGGPWVPLPDWGAPRLRPGGGWRGRDLGPPSG